MIVDFDIGYAFSVCAWDARWVISSSATQYTCSESGPPLQLHLALIKFRDLVHVGNAKGEILILDYKKCSSWTDPVYKWDARQCEVNISASPAAVQNGHGAEHASSPRGGKKDRNSFIWERKFANSPTYLRINSLVKKKHKVCLNRCLVCRLVLWMDVWICIVLCHRFRCKIR